LEEGEEFYHESQKSKVLKEYEEEKNIKNDIKCRDFI
jgi:hypothetical protein